MSEQREKIVGLLIEQFLNKGLGTIRSMCEQAFIHGQKEAYARGRADGTAERNKMWNEITEHMNRWQSDREELMRLIPGYEYKPLLISALRTNPESDKAKEACLVVGLGHQGGSDCPKCFPSTKTKEGGR